MNMESRATCRTLTGCVVAAAFVLWATGCTGLALTTHPTVGGELQHEMRTEADLWTEHSHPTSGQMELRYERPSHGDLWMSVDDAGIPPKQDEDDADSDLPPRLERLLDLMEARSP